jgi:hypothetical protein
MNGQDFVDFPGLLLFIVPPNLFYFQVKVIIFMQEVYIGNLNNVVKRWGRFYKIFLQKVENC